MKRKLRVTHSYGYDGGAVFSRDGRQILFSSNKHACDSSKFELYPINTDGTGLRSDWKAPARYEFNVFTADWKQ